MFKRLNGHCDCGCGQRTTAPFIEGHAKSYRAKLFQRAHRGDLGALREVGDRNWTERFERYQSRHLALEKASEPALAPKPAAVRQPRREELVVAVDNRYTVHEGDGLLGGAATVRSRHEQRGDARKAAIALIGGGARLAEVRRNYYLLDQYVRRGTTVKHIYVAKVVGAA